MNLTDSQARVVCEKLDLDYKIQNFEALIRSGPFRLLSEHARDEVYAEYEREYKRHASLCKLIDAF